MKKRAVLVIIFALLLSACAVGPFTETMYVQEDEPATAPEFEAREYYSPEEMEHTLQFVEYGYGHAGFQLFLPRDWNYSIVEYNADAGEFGIDFWPDGSGERKLRLRYYSSAFGVCGTDLVEREGELPGTGKLRVGYYDGQDYPSFISFYDSPGGYALMNELGSGWNAHWEEIEKILSSLVLDPGVMRVSVAEEIAQDSCVWEDYDYLRTDFDILSGSFTVEFVKMGGEKQATVILEKYNNEYIVIADE